MKVVRLSALHTGRLYPQEIFLLIMKGYLRKSAINTVEMRVNIMLCMSYYVFWFHINT